MFRLVAPAGEPPRTCSRCDGGIECLFERRAKEVRGTPERVISRTSSGGNVRLGCHLLTMIPSGDLLKRLGTHGILRGRVSRRRELERQVRTMLYQLSGTPSRRAELGGLHRKDLRSLASSQPHLQPLASPRRCPPTESGRLARPLADQPRVIRRQQRRRARVGRRPPSRQGVPPSVEGRTSTPSCAAPGFSFPQASELWRRGSRPRFVAHGVPAEHLVESPGNGEHASTPNDEVLHLRLFVDGVGWTSRQRSCAAATSEAPTSPSRTNADRVGSYGVQVPGWSGYRSWCRAV